LEGVTEPQIKEELKKIAGTFEIDINISKEYSENRISSSQFKQFLYYLLNAS
jgi:hypothetical protein